MRTRELATAVLAGMAASPALAQETTLPEVRVEASSLNPPAIQESPPEAVSPAPASDGGELLRAIPGVWGSRFGGAGIDPVIRGQDETQLNILLDGGYIHGGCPNRMDPPTAYAVPETYDRVKVIKGNQTVLYGGGGSGGTVLFERRTPRFEEGELFRGKAGAGYRSNSETKEAYADVATGSETGFARLIGSYKDAESYEDGDGEEVRSAYTHYNGAAVLGYTPDEATRLELGLEAMRGEDILYTGMMDAPETENDSARLKFEREAATGFLDGLKAQAYYSDVYHLMDNYSLRPDPMTRMRTPSDSLSYGGRLQGELFAGTATAWTVGLDYRFSNREAERFSDMMSTRVDTLQAIMWPDVDQAEMGVFAEMEHELGPRDRLRAGLRYDQVTAEAGRTDDATDAGTTPNDLYQQFYGTTADEQTEGNVGGLLRYAHDLGASGVTLHGTLSRSMRTADATERFIAGNGTMMMDPWVGNPDIDPEQHHQAEVGLTWASERSRVAASVYYNDVTDYILTDKIDDGTGTLATGYRNVDATLYGGELSATAGLGAGFSARATAAYVHGDNDTDDDPLPQIPPLEGTVGLDYESARWEAGAEVRMVDEQTRVDLDSGQDLQETPGYAVVNLRAAVHVTPSATVKLGADNLLDKNYSEHINRVDPNTGQGLLVNEPGRSIWAKVQAKF